MSDQIKEYSGLKLPKGVKFDGRHAVVISPIKGGGVVNWIFRVDRSFSDFGDVIITPDYLPVIIIGRQLGYSVFFVCASPIGVISVNNQRLLFEDVMK